MNALSALCWWFLPDWCRQVVRCCRQRLALWTCNRRMNSVYWTVEHNNKILKTVQDLKSSRSRKTINGSNERQWQLGTISVPKWNFGMFNRKNLQPKLAISQKKSNFQKVMNSPASNTLSLNDKITITDWSVSSSLFDRIVTPALDVHTSTQCTGGRYHGLWSYCSLWVAPRVPQSRTASPTWPASSWWQAMCTLHPKIIWTPSRELSCWRIVWKPAQAMIPATLSTMRRGSVCSSLPMQMPAQVSSYV